MPKNLSTVPSEVPMKVPLSSWAEGAASLVVGTASAAPMTNGTTVQSDRRNMSRQGVLEGVDL